MDAEPVLPIDDDFPVLDISDYVCVDTAAFQERRYRQDTSQTRRSLGMEPLYRFMKNEPVDPRL